MSIDIEEKLSKPVYELISSLTEKFREMGYSIKKISIDDRGGCGGGIISVKKLQNSIITALSFDNRYVRVLVDISYKHPEEGFEIAKELKSYLNSLK